MAQSLTQRSGTPVLTSAVVSGTVRLGGQVDTTTLRFGGQLDDLRFFAGSFTPPQLAQLTTSASACAAITASLVSPQSAAVFAAGGTPPLMATAESQNGGVIRVEFYAGTTLLGQSIGGHPWWLQTWSNVTAGTYSVTARAYDAQGGVATSAPVIVTVVDAGSPSSASAALPVAGSTHYAGGSVHIVATPTVAPIVAASPPTFKAGTRATTPALRPGPAAAPAHARRSASCPPAARRSIAQSVARRPARRTQSSAHS